MKKALLIYKRSVFEIYFLEREGRKLKAYRKVHPREMDRFELAHKHHYQTLRHVENVLRAYHIDYKKCLRGRNMKFSGFDFVITIGGDGTFLEAARHVTNQIILGVNSNPELSLGNFCATDARGFEKLLKKIISGKKTAEKIYRLRFRLAKQKPVDFLNDVLICHRNPAAMSRYLLTIGKTSEAHRCSGLWVSTAVGSSGAIHSAGGRRIKRTSKNVQYLPRELQKWPGFPNKLKGGVLMPKTGIRIKSLMRQGMIYVDGAHIRYPFSFGETAVISHSPNPIRII